MSKEDMEQEGVMDKEKDVYQEVCDICCGWRNENHDKAPARVAETYPKMMKVVLTRLFDLKKVGAEHFVQTACCGNWDRLHRSQAEQHLDAEGWRDMLLGDVFYCSDRWSWDRVLRVQWCYMQMLDLVHDERRRSGDVY